MTTLLPIIDVKPLVLLGSSVAEVEEVARQIADACRSSGFFYITGHGVSVSLQQRLETESRRFFAQPKEIKLAIHMSRGGRAWRGYFPVGEELTSGRPDQKEGLYLGTELSSFHPLVRAGTPLHGPNLFPPEMPELRDVVLSYMDAMTQLSHRVMEGIALGLGLARSYFSERYTTDPLTLFRVFNYPFSPSTNTTEEWGVGEHTDYGILTILKQDDAGGLQVKTPAGWIDAPPVENSFVCNIGDMLELMTGGIYRSTPHRVRNVSGRDRLSFPFFFDPNFFVSMRPIDLPFERPISDGDSTDRWDGKSVRAFLGTYGDYVLSKVGKVFPDLLRAVL